jgi:hypothetical protein
MMFISLEINKKHVVGLEMLGFAITNAKSENREVAVLAFIGHIV